MLRKFINYWDQTTFYLTKRFYYVAFAVPCLFVLSFFLPPLFEFAMLVLLALVLIVSLDALLLYRPGRSFDVDRLLDDRLSNGDDNPVVLRLTNRLPFQAHCTIIDELPFQFQERRWRLDAIIDQGATKEVTYPLRPKERGVYAFGNINVFVTGPLGFVCRRFVFQHQRNVKVYPSFIQMRRYQLMASASLMHEAGMRQVRRLGHSMEFEQIKEYVRGEDYRTINWKATARHGDFMVNTFTDERSQQIYCIINKGRVMKMPFDGISLLDYAINAALVVSNTALQKQDKAGLITYAQNVDAFVPADKKPAQINQILEALYRQETDFMEPDLEKLFSVIRNRITQRSLLIMFTNFESIESLERELPFFKRLARYHLLMVIFFENTELRELAEAKARTTEDIYIKTIAEKYRFEKQLIIKELQKHGIVALLSTPQKLTINALNKYLELKNRQSI